MKTIEEMWLKFALPALAANAGPVEIRETSHQRDAHIPQAEDRNFHDC